MVASETSTVTRFDCCAARTTTAARALQRPWGAVKAPQTPPWLLRTFGSRVHRRQLTTTAALSHRRTLSSTGSAAEGSAPADGGTRGCKTASERRLSPHMEQGCASCGEDRRAQFSKNQLSKRRERRCKACVAAGTAAGGSATAAASVPASASTSAAAPAGKKARKSRAPALSGPAAAGPLVPPPGAVVVDGSLMEGGGQVIRLSCSLAGLLGTPLHLHSIRAKRSKPGLANQHLTGLRLVADMCAAGGVGAGPSASVLQGAAVGATEVTFTPPPPSASPEITAGGGDSESITPERAVSSTRMWSVSTGGAGSLMLVLQVSLPVALFCCHATATATAPTAAAAAGPGGNHHNPARWVQLQLQGGTNAAMAPPVDFFTGVLAPILRQHCGIKLEVEMKRRGYFPQGGGELTVRTHNILHHVAYPCIDAVITKVTSILPSQAHDSSIE